MFVTNPEMQDASHYDSRLFTSVGVGFVATNRSGLKGASQKFEFTTQIWRQELVGYSAAVTQFSALVRANNDIAYITIFRHDARKEPAYCYTECAADRVQRLDRRGGYSPLDLAKITLRQARFLAELRQFFIPGFSQEFNLAADRVINIQNQREIDLLVGVFGKAVQI